MADSSSRADGRSANQIRPLRFQNHIAPYAAGSTLIEWGNTRVICGVSIEETVPRWMKEQKVEGGWLTAEYSMLPYSTLQRKQRDINKGKLDGRSSEIQRLIGRPMQFATPKKTTYFTSEGRIGRQEYLKTAVLLPFATIVAVAMLTALDKNVGVLFVIGVGLPVLGMTILATMRRFHDLGYSGAWVLPCMIPYIGWIGLIALCVAPGAVGVNRFGADPIQR